jgi:hypothetical protein
MFYVLSALRRFYPTNAMVRLGARIQAARKSRKLSQTGVGNLIRAVSTQYGSLTIAGMLKIVGAFIGRKCLEKLADELAERIDGACSAFAQGLLQLGERQGPLHVFIMPDRSHAADAEG